MDLTELQGLASERLLLALQNINQDAPEGIHTGLHELTSLTKRTDDVTECLDVLLKAQLLPKVLSFMRPELLGAYEGEATVRGVAVTPVRVQLGEAVQLAALTALGELIWQRDTSSEVRPVLLEAGGVGVLTALMRATPSERVRLKTLVVTRRVLYEVGSTAAMDPAAIQAAESADLLGCLVQLLGRVVQGGDDSASMDTLEGVTYLLQRMQACLSPEQQAALGLAGHLRTAAALFTQLMHQRSAREALDMSLLGVRELCWDDHNNPLDPAISQFAEAGAFEGIAALFAPPGGSSRGSFAGEPAAVPLPLLAAVAAGTVTNQVMGAACQLLERLAAAKPGTLPQALEVQVPRLFHQVIFQLVDQLDHSLHAPDRQETALFALRKLLVTEHSQHVSKPAAEAAEAEGVPARLLLVARSGAAFGGPTEGMDVTPEATARAAAALLAELTASTAMLAAQEGRPAQAADALATVEPIVAPLVGQLGNNVDASRSFCRVLCSLSIMRWDAPAEGEGADDAAAAPARVAPPEAEQYALSSRLVTLVGQVAQGLTGLLQGGYVVKRATLGPAGHSHMHIPGARKHSSVTALPSAAQLADVGSVDPAASPGAEALQLALGGLQRTTMLVHDLAGLKPQATAGQLSRHNIDALFVHGTFQALVQQTHYWYTHKRSLLRALARAEAEAAANESLEGEISDDASGCATPPAVSAASSRSNSMPGISGFSFTSSRASSMSASANPLLHPLLNQDAGVLELFKELVRDCAEARLRLRDIGALPMFARMLADNPRDNLLVSVQFNLARSEALQAALKQEGCISLMEKVLAQAPQGDGAYHEVRRLLALCVLGLVASDDSSSGDSDADSRRAAALMAKHDITGFMERILREACRDGRYVISNSTSAWPFFLEPAAYTVGCLARVDETARKLAERGIPAFLFSALANKHGSAPEPALRIVRAILHFARLPDLRAGLLALGATEALMPFTEVEDQRTCDAARGCLLQLGELPDLAAKMALQATLHQALQPALSSPLPPQQEEPRHKSGAGASSSSSSGAGVEPAYDVLICYKRQDAQALARMMHTALLLRGVGCLLDYGYQPDLSDVEQVVARARNLLVILTDNCLTSPRCLAELQAAAKFDLNVIMVVKEGARWGDMNGNMLSMPPQQTIKALRPELHKLFTMKAIHHRDEHYAYFVNQLMKRIKTAPPPPRPPTSQRNMSSLSRVGSPGRSEGRPPPLSHASPGSLKAHTQPSAGSADGRSTAGRPAILSGLNPEAPRTSSSGQAGPLIPGSMSPAELQSLQSALAAQTALLGELSREVASIKSAMAGLGGLQAVVSGLQGSVSSLAGELSGLRRELAAEIAASGRNVTAEVVAGTAQVRQAVAAETSAQGAALSAIKSDIASIIASLKGGDLGGNLSGQMRTLAADVSEVRRGLADCVSGVVAVQSQVRVLVGSRSELSAHALEGVSGASSASSTFARTSPAILTSMHSEGVVYQSSPVRMSGGHEQGALQPLTSLSTSINGTLPPLMNSGPQSNGNMTSRGADRERERVRTSPGKSVSGVVVGQLGHAPQVGGFQGARIAAMQAKINALPRGRQ